MEKAKSKTKAPRKVKKKLKLVPILDKGNLQSEFEKFKDIPLHDKNYNKFLLKTENLEIEELT